MHEFSKLIKDKLKEAIKHFGRYQFEDKGSSEVMDIGSLVSMFKKLSNKDKKEVIKDFKNNRDCSLVLIDIISGVSELTNNEVEDLVKEGHPELKRYFNKSPNNGILVQAITSQNFIDLIKK